MRKILQILFVVLVSVNFLSCKKNNTTPPVVSTINVSQVTYTSAVSGGTISNNGGSDVSSCGVCIGLAPDPDIKNTSFTGTFTSRSYNVNLNQLTPNTKYYARAFATNEAGTGYGNQVTFTTLEAKVPVVGTIEISSVKQRSAQSGGTISDERGSSVISRGVCWGTDHLPVITGNKTDEGSGTSQFQSTLTGLRAGTMYYVRAYATNSLGTGYGEERNFTTVQSTLPVLTTSPAISIRRTSAISGGSITDDGGSDIIAHGLCWSTTLNPTTNDNRTNDGAGFGFTTRKISGLTESTTYYLRAYATTLAGTAYGNEISFKTFGGPVFNPDLSYGTVSDIDGNVYKTITIGGREWMAENLKVSKYNDGTLTFGGTILMHVKDGVSWNMATPAFCWYNNDSINFDIYGTLYNWYAVSSGKLCPSGWHVPSLSEWTLMINVLGGESTAGESLKEASLNHWSAPNTGATNASGFTALPGGVWGPYETSSSGMGNYGHFWTSSSYYDDRYGWTVHMSFDDRKCTSGWPSKMYGQSVRCVKD